MAPISFSNQQLVENELLPGPLGTPVHPLGDSFFTNQEQGLSDKLTEQPKLRQLLETSTREPAPSAPGSTNREIIRQRYPDGKIQIEREVAQDTNGNYYNDGIWKLLNKQGQPLAEGQFAKGRMSGFWKRWHPATSSGIFATEPYNRFNGPFLSTATFVDGRLDGMWTMYDRDRKKIFEIPYLQGKRNGTAQWWLPNGVPMREVTFYNDVMEGSLKEWDFQRKLVRHDEFVGGKKILRQTSYFRGKRKETENLYLSGPLELDGEDDWWAARSAEYRAVGDPVQHGPAKAWHENEQKKMQGQYRDGMRVGTFDWWHANGQRQLTGSYQNGEKTGQWTWWHDNGFKSIEGSYTDDTPTGIWTWWNEDGTVQSSKDLTPDSQRIEQTDPVVDPPSEPVKARQTPEIETIESLPSPLDEKKDLPNNDQANVDEGPEIKPGDDPNDEAFDLGEMLDAETLAPPPDNSATPNDNSTTSSNNA